MSRTILARAACLVVLVAPFSLLSPLSPPAVAGSFVFAGEGSEDRITHPTGYTGAATPALAVSVCIDPTSAHTTEMVIPVKNAIAVWNELQATTGNIAAANVPFLEFDFESTALHELGHCIGLGHPNVGALIGLSQAQTDFTESTDGADDTLDLGAGSDGTEGSADDQRNDDGNLNYFRTSNNDPFTIEPVTVDSTTYSRSLASLPGGDSYSANCDRQVGDDLGFADSECSMQQGLFNGEAKRTLGHDDVATLRLGMSGLDETQGTADDYTVELAYAGLTDTCDVVLDFDDTQTGFAVCFVNGTFLSPADHLAITQGNIYFNTGTQLGNEFDWFFNPIPLSPPGLPATAAWGGLTLVVGVATSGCIRLAKRRR